MFMDRNPKCWTYYIYKPEIFLNSFIFIKLLMSWFTIMELYKFTLLTTLPFLEKQQKYGTTALFHDFSFTLQFNVFY